MNSTTESGARSSGVMIVSLPWNIEQFTSLQIAALRAFLASRSVEATSRHYHKDIVDYLAHDVRSHVHEYGYGEHLFGALYYPDRADDFIRVINDKFTTPPLGPVLSALNRFCDDVVQDIAAVGPALLGFTTTHVQVMSSLYVARRIKSRLPSTRIVLGGLALFSDFSQQILRLFPEVDYVVNGEGESALLDLAHHSRGDEVDLGSVGGLTWRSDGVVLSNPRPAVTTPMDDLPLPDIDDYLFRHLHPEKRQISYPTVCVESARACSWGKCTFCIESIPSRGAYRVRSAKTVVDQIQSAVEAARSVDVAFTDPDMSSRRDVFEEIATRGMDLRIDAEVSGMVDLPTLIAMKHAGLKALQIGIESFSPELLRRFAKGVQLVHYVELMRWCRQLDLSLVYNIIIGAPFETQEELDVADRNMRLLFPYAPPVISEFVVSLGSPIYQNLDDYGIEELLPLPETVCYPDDVRAGISPLISFHAGYDFVAASRPEVDRSGLLDAVREWWERSDTGFHLNAYRGRGFIDVEYVLGNAQRHVEIRDACEVHLLSEVAVEARSLHRIAAEPGCRFALDDLREAADALIARGLLFESDRKVIAVPIFPRIDLTRHVPSRSQRLDLPWLRTESRSLRPAARP